MRTLDTILAAKGLSPPYWFGISDRQLFRNVETLDYLRALFRTRADALLWREKDLSREVNRIFVKEGVKLASDLGKLFLVSTDYRLAIEEHAEGAHLASDQDLLEARGVARELASSQFILGKSAHSTEETVQAESQGADYVLLAPVFDPISKPVYRRSLELENLQEAVRSVSIPVFALGGIMEGNGHLALEAGAYGLAGISLLVEDLDRSLKES